MSKPKGGRREGAGRPAGSSGAKTVAERAAWQEAYALLAREAWEVQRRLHRRDPRNNERPGPRPDPEDFRACVRYLARLRHSAIIRALVRNDYSAAVAGVAGAEQRAFGRPKFEHVVEGAEDGAPVKVEQSGEVTYVCVVPRRAPRPT